MRRASLLVGAVGSGLLAIAAVAADGPELPRGPNRAAVYGACRTCHDLQYLVESAGIPRAAWSDILDSMKQYGLRVAPDQRAKILDYLGTYLGPNPPISTAAAAPAAAPAATVDGAKVFTEQCSACHQPNGQGVAGQFPPLAGNRDLFLSANYPAMVVLGGLSGKIEVEGKAINSVMPPLNFLSDTEVAAAVNYVRTGWGNDKLGPAGMAPLDAAAVAQVRAQHIAPGEVYAHRRQLKAAQK
jgi:mono/diheme cytochrome c family protein